MLYHVFFIFHIEYSPTLIEERHNASGNIFNYKLISDPTMGDIVWKQENYTFQENSVKWSKISIILHQISIIFIATVNSTLYDGWFSYSLSNNSWVPEIFDDKLNTSNLSLDRIWSKCYFTKQVTKVDIPQLTSDFIGLVFIQGNALHLFLPFA